MKEHFQTYIAGCNSLKTIKAHLLYKQNMLKNVSQLRYDVWQNFIRNFLVCMYIVCFQGKFFFESSLFLLNNNILMEASCKNILVICTKNSMGPCDVTKKLRSRDADSYRSSLVCVCYRRNGYFSRIRSGWPKLTGGMEPGMNTNIQTKYMKSKYVRISLRNIFFTSSFKNALQYQDCFSK